MVARWIPEIRQTFFASISHFFLSTPPVPGDGLVLDVTSTHYYEKYSSTSTTVGRSVALVIINSSDRWRKRERGAMLTDSDRWSKRERGTTLTSRCNAASMR